MTLNRVRWFLLLASFTIAAWSPQTAVAQERRFPDVSHLRRGDPRFDFDPNGAWRTLGRLVSRNRNALVAVGDFRALNAPAAPGAALASTFSVSGVRKVAAILFRFSDKGFAAGNFTPAQYDPILFGATAPVGQPYSVRSFYKDMSTFPGNPSGMDLQGQVVGWVQLAGTESQYNGGTACQGTNPVGFSNCNGVWSGTAFNSMQSGLIQALQQADATVDFSQFDNNGPDGIPNTADDDGFVDLVYFMQSEKDGACASSTNNHLWAHRSRVNFQTADASAKGGFVIVRDYVLQSGLGGPGACDSTKIMPIGTVAHETGHAFGLPDLYDTDGSGGAEGIGQWGLMGSGNYTSAASPSRMEAWSLNELGWVTLAPITTTGVYTFGAAPVSDTAFLIRANTPNARGERFLIENRQAVQSDSAMLRFHCAKSGRTLGVDCSGGLLIWHVDSQKVVQGLNANAVNVGNPYGVKLEQADGLNDLGTRGRNNRGDAGDEWPGTTNKTAFTGVSNPAALKNSDGKSVGFIIDQIAQNVPNGEMQFRVSFGTPTVIRAVDTLAKVQVDGAAFNRFANVLAAGVTVNFTSPQVSTDGRRRFTWQSWSDGGAQSHAVPANLTPTDSIVAQVQSQYQLKVTTLGAGVVTSDTVVDLVNGAFIPQFRAVTLTATAPGGAAFNSWSGDTTGTNTTMVLPMGRPYNVTATFAGALATGPAPPNGVMGKQYSVNMTATGGTGTYSWSIQSGSLPTGVQLFATGLISGTPTLAGSSDAVIRVQSGGQSATQNVTIAVTEPTLATGSVVAQLLGTGTSLSADDLKYLDLLGNNNNAFDVGDFLAWVNKTNATPSAEAMEQIAKLGTGPGKGTAARDGEVRP